MWGMSGALLRAVALANVHLAASPAAQRTNVRVPPSVSIAMPLILLGPTTNMSTTVIPVGYEVSLDILIFLVTCEICFVSLLS